MVARGMVVSGKGNVHLEGQAIWNRWHPKRILGRQFAQRGKRWKVSLFRRSTKAIVSARFAFLSNQGNGVTSSQVIVG